MRSTPALNDLDLTDYSLYRNGFPHGTFARLRSEAPVWRHPENDALREAGVGSFWVLSRHEDLRLVHRDPETFSSFDGAAIRTTAEDRKGKMLISMDGQDHGRLRRLISRGFTPRMIDALEEHLRWRTETILDAVVPGTEIDFVRDVAELLPLHVIADIIGIPEGERDEVFNATKTILRAFDPEGGVGLDQRLRKERELFDYATAFNRRKRALPADDVWSILVTAQLVEGDGRSTQLSDHELDLFFLLLAAAGSETTRNAISLGLFTLVEHPDELARLRANPELLDVAVEEILRWTSPNSYFRKTTTREVEIRGVRIPAGETVTIWHPSANRDEAAFDDPFTFDVGRSPNNHVTFGGGGPHFCIGAALARRELRVIFQRLLDRYAKWEVVGDPVWAVPGPLVTVVCSLDSLCVRLS